MSTKQVIVIRKDLKMRRGKEIAQGAHASMSFLTRAIQEARTEDGRVYATSVLPAVALEWLEGSFRKVVCQVDSLDALMDVVNAADHAGIDAHIVTDAGLTEFAGDPTITAIAIGPDYDEKIDPITGHLELY